MNMAELSTAGFPLGVHERRSYDLWRKTGEQTADLQPQLFRRQLLRLSTPPGSPEEVTPIKNSSNHSMEDFQGCLLAFV